MRVAYALFDENAVVVERCLESSFAAAQRTITEYLKENVNGAGGIYSGGKFVSGTSSMSFSQKGLRMPTKECGYTSQYLWRTKK